jgi:hypothetical protein
MSIRFPHELAAAAEYAERAVDGSAAIVPAEREVRFADAPYEFSFVGEPIRVIVGLGFIPAGAPRKLIPGQTYH